MNDITKTNIPRFVEQTNARLEIRRDESQANNRRKKDSEADTNQTFEWDEMAAVSVMSLYAFLGTLLESHISPENPPPPPEHAPKTSLQKQAIGAYHRNQSYAPPPPVVAPPPIPDPLPEPAPSTGDDGSVTLSSDFSERDLGRIQSYRNDLMELNRRGITEIQLERSATFLDAIGDAITRAKAAF